jgi:hypothetical protein
MNNIRRPIISSDSPHGTRLNAFYAVFAVPVRDMCARPSGRRRNVRTLVRGARRDWSGRFDGATFARGFRRGVSPRAFVMHNIAIEPLVGRRSYRYSMRHDNALMCSLYGRRMVKYIPRAAQTPVRPVFPNGVDKEIYVRYCSCSIEIHTNNHDA